MRLSADKCQWKEVTCARLSLSQVYLKASLSSLCKNMCFLASRKPLLVHFCVVVWALLVYSRTPVTRTLKGNEKQFELAGIRVIRVTFSEILIKAKEIAGNSSYPSLSYRGSTVFSIFRITSLGDCTHLQLQETTAKVLQKKAQRMWLLTRSQGTKCANFLNWTVLFWKYFGIRRKEDPW